MCRPSGTKCVFCLYPGFAHPGGVSEAWVEAINKPQSRGDDIIGSRNDPIFKVKNTALTSQMCRPRPDPDQSFPKGILNIVIPHLLNKRRISATKHGEKFFLRILINRNLKGLSLQPTQQGLKERDALR